VNDEHLLALARRVLEIEADAVRALAPRLDARFAAAVRLLRACEGRVIVAGMGKSGLIGRKIAATLASTGTPAYFLHPAEGVHGDLGVLVRGDVLVLLSNSGETDELLAIIPSVKRLAVPMLLLTGAPDSALARVCDVVLDVAVREEACPLDLAPTASTTAALALGDALAMALLEVRGFRPEDYGDRHPRGTLGWKSTLRVRDLMHTGDAIPVVAEDVLMKEVIEEMTRKRFGMTTVVDRAGRLAGVITDGDLRRLLLRGEAFDVLRAGEAATRAPKTIDADALAASALELMEASGPITSLVVLDGAGRPAGIVRMHDIVRAKIV
jgi:arabinose-5-phosphate isomerase